MKTDQMVPLLRVYDLTTQFQACFIPIWGTCMGFELLAEVISGNESILTDTVGTENVGLRENSTNFFTRGT